MLSHLALPQQPDSMEETEKKYESGRSGSTQENEVNNILTSTSSVCTAVVRLASSSEIVTAPDAPVQPRVKVSPGESVGNRVFVNATTANTDVIASSRRMKDVNLMIGGLQPIQYN